MTRYLNSMETCEHFAISMTKLKTMLSDGTIPSDTYIRHGRTYRFNVDAVEKALLQHPKAPADDMQLSFDFGEGETDE